MAVAEASVEYRYTFLSSTCHITPTGLSRVLPPVAAVAYKAPGPSIGGGSGGGRGAIAIASRKRKHAEEVRGKRAEADKVVKKRKDGKPLNASQQRKAAAPPGSGMAKKVTPKPAMAALTAAQLMRQAEVKRDAAMIHENAKRMRLEVTVEVPMGPVT